MSRHADDGRLLGGQRNGMTFVVIDDLDLIDGWAPEGWLAVEAPAAKCDCRGDKSHWLWWESKADGNLHCIDCWANSPPPRTMVCRIWESSYFGERLIALYSPSDRPWPWPDDQPVIATEGY